MTKHIGIIGVGSMGGAIAEGLLSANHRVTIYNRTAHKTERFLALGARAATSAAEAIETTDAAILVLTDGSATRHLLSDTATYRSLRGRRVLNVAATTVDEIKEIDRLVASAGGRLAEVNVTVYAAEVREREGHYVWAGMPEDAAFWRTVLTAIGPKVYDVGALGNASKAEGAVWLGYMFQTIAAAYPVAAFRKMGLPMDVIESILRENPTLRVTGSETFVPEMISRQYGSNQFSIDNFAATAQMMCKFAEELDLPTGVFKSIHGLYARASALGYGAKDVTAVFEALMVPSA